MGYLFVVAMTEATSARTYFLMGRTVEASIITSDCVAKVLLIFLEGRKKLLIPEAHSKAPEDLAGPISQAFFLWLNNLFLAGYQRAFVSADLGRISSPLYTKSIVPRFEHLVKGDIGKLPAPECPNSRLEKKVAADYGSLISTFWQSLRISDIQVLGPICARASGSKIGSNGLHFCAIVSGHSLAELLGL